MLSTAIVDCGWCFGIEPVRIYALSGAIHILCNAKCYSF